VRGQAGDMPKEGADRLEFGGQLVGLQTERKGLKTELVGGEYRAVDAALPGDCAFDCWKAAAERNRSQRCRARLDLDETWRYGARAIDVEVGGRYLCMGDGQREHVDEAFEGAVAAAGRGGRPD